jgi:hypothetical protein
LPSRDLRALFRTNLVDLDAVQVFANRDDERAAFDRAFQAHRDLVGQRQPEPQDLVAPRRNVLVYYGVGGVGKTTLSKQLQRRLTERDAEPPAGWPPVSEEYGEILTVRLDLGREAGLDVESLVLLLRAALAPVGRPMTAFDLALARYWKRAKRQSLGEYLHRNGMIERMPQARQMPELVNQAVSEVSSAAGLAGLGLLVQTGPRLVGYLRDRPRRRLAINECRRLPDLLEADATTESLSYFPYLLAWDLAQLQRDRDLSLVVFLDTFEEVGGQTNRELERIVQRAVWLVPNAFFVITGRNRLDWVDPGLADRLDWAGPVNWPGLDPGADEEPRQHLVGDISDVDSHRYLRQRLVRRHEPVIPAEVRQRIVANAHGLPLYLDLSVMRYLGIANNGEVPKPDDFDGAFPGIVASVFRDLDERERAVLRAVSLFDAFDVELAAVTAGQSSDAAALQLIQRPFVRHEPAAVWPYHMHTLVREQVRAADVGLADSWTEQDWRRAAGRALTYLGETASKARSGQDRRTLITCLNKGFQLAHDFGLPLGWLVDGAYWFIEDSVWEPFLRPPIVAEVQAGDVGPGSSAQALAVGLVAIAARQRVHREHTLALLERCLGTGLLAGDAADLLAYFRAECQRDLGNAGDSERGMTALLGPGRRMSDMALRGLSHLHRRRGRFRLLQSQLEGGYSTGVWQRVWGDLYWTQGRLPEAVDAYRKAVEWAGEQGLAGEAATSGACLAWAAALHSATSGAEAVGNARRLLEPVTVTWAELQVECAEIVLAAGSDTDVEQRYAHVQERARQNGLTSTAAYAALARAFHYAVVADLDRLSEARDGLRAHVRGDEFAYLDEIVEFWRGAGSGRRAAGADWLDGRKVTAARWRSIMEQRRRELEGGDRWPATPT